jgi:site-specific DNA recombinase
MPRQNGRSPAHRRPETVPGDVAKSRHGRGIARQRRGRFGAATVRTRVTSTAEIALHERCSERAVRITLSLAFLAPAIVKAAVEGQLPYGLTASSFSELPILWGKQLQIAS